MRIIWSAYVCATVYNTHNIIYVVFILYYMDLWLATRSSAELQNGVCRKREVYFLYKISREIFNIMNLLFNIMNLLFFQH